MKSKPIDVELVKSAFSYEHGNLYWLIAPSKNVKAGYLAGYLSKSGYQKVRLDRQEIFAHRIIYAMHYGDIPNDMHIDHINGIKHDNRIENLRLATNTENICNQKNAQVSNKTGFLGVSVDRNKFVAQIQIKGIKKRLGRFSNIQDASKAYHFARKEYFGEFA